MVILRLIATFFLLITPVFGAESINIKNVDIDCTGREECLYIIESFKKYEGKDLTREELNRVIQFELAKPYYKTFFYEVKKGRLNIVVETKPRILSVYVKGTDSVLNRRIKNDFNLKEGDYYDETTAQEGLKAIGKEYFKKGSKVGTITKELNQEGVKLTLNLLKNEIRRLEEIRLNGLFGVKLKESEKFWHRIRGTSLDFTNYKKMLQEYRTQLIRDGFWLSRVKEELKVLNNGNYELIFNIELGSRFGVNFHNNYRLNHNDLLSHVKKYIQNNKGRFDDISLNRHIVNFYRENGYYYAKSKLTEAKGFDLNGNNILNLYFTINEGRKVTVSQVNFNGNHYKDNKRLRNIYYKTDSDLLKADYLHERGLENASEKIKELYVKDGYIFVNIEKPKVDFIDGGDAAVVSFSISEGAQYILSKINIEGIEDEEAKYFIEDVLKNKIGKPFNVVHIDEDLKNALISLKTRGYYFSSYSEKRPKKIVNVNSATNEIELNLKFGLGVKTYLGNVIVTGNSATKDVVIRRELPLVRGDLVTPKAMNDFIARLRELGLFSNVNISSFVGEEISPTEKYLNFVIKVTEKDFGLAEIAPGFRTDLGLKFSSTISYNNFNGMNRSFIFKAQTNWRTDFSYLDDRRKQDSRKLLEGLVQFQYVEPYLFYDLFNSKVTFKATARYERKRYSDFDADIISFSPQLIKTFSDVLSMSLTYEFDNIRQFDATDAIDEDKYIIGAIRPELTLDFRDNKTLPKKGSWFNFSWEFANPYLGSQESEDLTIDYHKAVVRNFNYIPMGDITLATSIALGYEHNFSSDIVKDSSGNVIIDSDGKPMTTGYIPPLKVFRLIGRDYLRGYSDLESGRLNDGSYINDTTVRGEAYFVNFRLEPRYYIGDYSAIAVFFDAGRVFVDKIDNFDLLKSVGMSFKFFTPIGSLDFDYGVKLDRIGGDSFGRFHITIGQF
ncbi:MULTISPECIES: outer membrane protein assembly factor [unclassified Halobacteriovorax]|uniref:BamA/OMP85 family outer membrane protein n=1 Tax=unclassified Halobacteriovorax TaxID=2639665 RepID=UPI00399ADBC5